MPCRVVAVTPNKVLFGGGDHRRREEIGDGESVETLQRGCKIQIELEHTDTFMMSYLDSAIQLSKSPIAFDAKHHDAISESKQPD